MQYTGGSYVEVQVCVVSVSVSSLANVNHLS